MKLLFVLLLAYLGTLAVAFGPFARRAIGGGGCFGGGYIIAELLRKNDLPALFSSSSPLLPSGTPISNFRVVDQRCPDGSLRCLEPVSALHFPITTVTSPPLTLFEVSVMTETKTETTFVLPPAPTSNTTMAPIVSVESTGYSRFNLIAMVSRWYNELSPGAQKLIAGILPFGSGAFIETFILQPVLMAISRHGFQHPKQILEWVRPVGRFAWVVLVKFARAAWRRARGPLKRSRRATLRYLKARIARLISMLVVGTGFFSYISNGKLLSFLLCVWLYVDHYWRLQKAKRKEQTLLKGYRGKWICQRRPTFGLRLRFYKEQLNRARRHLKADTARDLARSTGRTSPTSLSRYLQRPLNDLTSANQLGRDPQTGDESLRPTSSPAFVPNYFSPATPVNSAEQLFVRRRNSTTGVYEYHPQPANPPRPPVTAFTTLSDDEESVEISPERVRARRGRKNPALSQRRFGFSFRPPRIRPTVHSDPDSSSEHEAIDRSDSSDSDSDNNNDSRPSTRQAALASSSAAAQRARLNELDRMVEKDDDERQLQNVARVKSQLEALDRAVEEEEAAELRKQEEARVVAQREALSSMAVNTTTEDSDEWPEFLMSLSVPEAPSVPESSPVPEAPAVAATSSVLEPPVEALIVRNDATHPIIIPSSPTTIQEAEQQVIVRQTSTTTEKDQEQVIVPPPSCTAEDDEHQVIIPPLATATEEHEQQVFTPPGPTTREELIHALSGLKTLRLDPIPEAPAHTDNPAPETQASAPEPNAEDLELEQNAFGGDVGLQTALLRSYGVDDSMPVLDSVEWAAFEELNEQEDASNLHSTVDQATPVSHDEQPSAGQPASYPPITTPSTYVPLEPEHYLPEDVDMYSSPNPQRHDTSITVAQVVDTPNASKPVTGDSDIDPRLFNPAFTQDQVMEEPETVLDPKLPVSATTQDQVMEEPGAVLDADTGNRAVPEEEDFDAAVEQDRRGGSANVPQEEQVDDIFGNFDGMDGNVGEDFFASGWDEPLPGPPPGEEANFNPPLTAEQMAQFDFDIPDFNDIDYTALGRDLAEVPKIDQPLESADNGQPPLQLPQRQASLLSMPSGPSVDFSAPPAPKIDQAMESPNNSQLPAHSPLQSLPQWSNPSGSKVDFSRPPAPLVDAFANFSNPFAFIGHHSEDDDSDSDISSTEPEPVEPHAEPSDTNASIAEEGAATTSSTTSAPQQGVHESGVAQPLNIPGAATTVFRKMANLRKPRVVNGTAGLPLPLPLPPPPPPPPATTASAVESAAPDATMLEATAAPAPPSASTLPTAPPPLFATNTPAYESAARDVTMSEEMAAPAPLSVSALPATPPPPPATNATAVESAATDVTMSEDTAAPAPMPLSAPPAQPASPPATTTLANESAALDVTMSEDTAAPASRPLSAPSAPTHNMELIDSKINSLDDSNFVVPNENMSGTEVSRTPKPVPTPVAPSTREVTMTNAQPRPAPATPRASPRNAGRANRPAPPPARSLLSDTLAYLDRPRVPLAELQPQRRPAAGVAQSGASSVASVAAPVAAPVQSRPTVQPPAEREVPSSSRINPAKSTPTIQSPPESEVPGVSTVNPESTWATDETWMRRRSQPKSRMSRGRTQGNAPSLPLPDPNFKMPQVQPNKPKSKPEVSDECLNMVVDGDDTATYGAPTGTYDEPSTPVPSRAPATSNEAANAEPSVSTPMFDVIAEEQDTPSTTGSGRKRYTPAAKVAGVRRKGNGKKR